MNRILWALLLLTLNSFAAEPPVITWASDPVRPDETVLLRGGGFGTAPLVEYIRHLNRESDGKPAEWTKVPALQASDDALKFVIPATEKPGVFECRVIVDGVASASVVLNRPDVWWLQGDAGPDATPGGWLCVFGKCLGTELPLVEVHLVPADGKALVLHPDTADGWSLRCGLPADLAPGKYTVDIYNGQGHAGARSKPLTLTINAPAPWPTTVYNILESSGPNAVNEMRKSLVKYGQPIEHTAEVLAALDKAKTNGGGIVYFPAGRYHLKVPLQLPPHTVLKGEGMGLVTLWWGSGKFNMDGGPQKGLGAEAEPETPPNLISGPSFGIEDLSIYLPLTHRTGIDGGGEIRMHRVRVRIDHLWAMDGSKRPEGLVARLGKNFEVTDCDIVAKAEGFKLGEYGIIARNKVLSGKTPCPLGSSRGIIVEDNQFISTYPTAYQNLAGVGQDIYYAHNRHEALNVHQADFSCTFDLGGSAYHGTLASIEGTKLTLAGDPKFPKWADEKSALWRKAVVCIVSGKGCTQWRTLQGFTGREWTLSEPFAVPPDDKSLLTIVPLAGRVLMIGNRFEDANWINAGFGTGIDIIYAENKLVRCAELLNYGMASPDFLCPNFNVQYLDNELSEGLSSIVIGGSVRPAESFSGQITQNIIHRREKLSADNCGGFSIKGALREIILENCTALHPASVLKVERAPGGVLVRKCRSATGELPCEGVTQVP